MSDAACNVHASVTDDEESSINDEDFETADEDSETSGRDSESDDEDKKIWRQRVTGTTTKYLKTAVLLVSWEDLYDDLNTKQEVQELANLLRSKYRFDVDHLRLQPKKNPQVQLNRGLANFVAENDDDPGDTRLIVYYAGHGSFDESSKDFRLQAGAHHSLPDDLTVWNKAENILADSSADVLAVFDCCHAGSVASVSSLLPKSSNEQCFEFLAACGRAEWTSGPGPKSFTCALIWALKTLQDKGPFTTLELCHKISQAPELPTTQTPQLLRSPRSDTRRIVLNPSIHHGNYSPELDWKSSVLENMDGLRDRLNWTYSSIETLSRDFYHFIQGRGPPMAIYRSLESGDVDSRQRHTYNALVDEDGSSLVHAQLPSPSSDSVETQLALFLSPVESTESPRTRLLQFLSGLFKEGRARNIIQDKTTVHFTTTSLLIISVAFTVRASLEPRTPKCTSIPSIDDNFYSNLSQMALSICSIYLTIVPLLRSQSLQSGYKFWYRSSLVLSLVTAVASAAVYPYAWRCSIILGLVSGLAQTIGTVQLVECIQDAVDTGEVGSVELRLL